MNWHFGILYPMNKEIKMKDHTDILLAPLNKLHDV